MSGISLLANVESGITNFSNQPYFDAFGRERVVASALLAISISNQCTGVNYQK